MRLGGRGPSLVPLLAAHAAPPETCSADGGSRSGKAPLREEEVIGNLSALLFTSSAGVTEFLNTGGNAALLEGPLFKVGGLAAAEDGEPATAVFAVPTGVGRLLADYRGVRGFANVIITVHPEQGSWRLGKFGRR